MNYKNRWYIMVHVGLHNLSTGDTFMLLIRQQNEIGNANITIVTKWWNISRACQR